MVEISVLHFGIYMLVVITPPCRFFKVLHFDAILVLIFSIKYHKVLVGCVIVLRNCMLSKLFLIFYILLKMRKNLLMKLKNVWLIYRE